MLGRHSMGGAHSRSQTLPFPSYRRPGRKRIPGGTARRGTCHPPIKTEVDLRSTLGRGQQTREGGMDKECTLPAVYFPSAGTHCTSIFTHTCTRNESRRKQSPRRKRNGTGVSVTKRWGWRSTKSTLASQPGRPLPGLVTLIESFSQPPCASVSKSEPRKEETYFFGLFLRSTTQQGLDPHDVVTTHESSPPHPTTRTQMPVTPGYIYPHPDQTGILLPACQARICLRMAEESTRSRRRPGSSAPKQGLGSGETEGLNQKLRRLPDSGWARGRDLGGGLRGRGRGFVPEAEGLAYPAAHPEASGGCAGQAAEPQPGPGPGCRSPRKARRRSRKKRLRPAPASFSRAALTRRLSPAGAGCRARDPVRAAQVPVRLWRAVSETRWSPGGAPGLLMPRAGARWEDLKEVARREREREIVRARGAAPHGVRGR